MTMTFKQLVRDSVVKRADAFKVRYGDIVVDPAFNTRENGERLQAHIQGIFQFIMSGGEVPDLEVIPMDGGKVQVVDGHCRCAAFGLAIAAGKEIEWISVRPFKGDDADRTARIATSNEGLKLTPLETARVYKRLRDQFSMGPEHIARKVGKTRQHVDQLLHLADASPEVQQMVADGTVAATEAIKVARTHGDKAADVLTDAAKKAGKVTGKTLKPWTPPARIVAPVVATLDNLHKSLPTATRMDLLNEPPEGATVSIPARIVWQLLNQHCDISDERTKAEEKARAKAAQAAQGDLTAADGA